MSESGPVIAQNGDIVIGTLTGVSRYSRNGQLLWSNPIGETYATPAIGPDGTIYIAPLFHNTYGLYALNADGSIRWRQPTGSGRRTLSSPVITNQGLIIHAAVDQGISAYRPDGSLAWRQSTSDYYISSPALSPDGDTVYVADDSVSLKAINAETGAQRWEFATRGARSSPAVGTDGTIFIGTDDRSMLALNYDGTVKWQYFTGGSFNQFFGSPAIASDGTVIACDEEGTLYAFRPGDGSIRWSKQISTFDTSPVIGADNTIYIGGGSALFALNINGTELWHKNGLTVHIPQPAIDAQGDLYLVTTNPGVSQFQLVAVPEPQAMSVILILSCRLAWRRSRRIPNPGTSQQGP